ncbi:hypothetical protein IEO21_01947 [Rhodonia placenta]|uniref:Major facilitator superfamily (MFS) profile domain-containing protein n=1 Tax=Rhodonia placenta TaxID=104341 RepID=A0A8H7P8J9_9APHY|nr:hypothetical protein IEO21_01947 [Postia placenta]
MSYTVDVAGAAAPELPVESSLDLKENISDDAHNSKQVPRKRTSTRREIVGSYMAIAAAAFGLFSDGCDVLGQLLIGVLCDRVGRKAGVVITTSLIVIGAILATAAHGSHGSIVGLFWFLTVARGTIGVGTGGEYPASSTSASEAANELTVKQRGRIFLAVTNGLLSFGTPFAVAVFLIVLEAAGENHLETVWRVCFAIGIVFPLLVFYFHHVPYRLAFKRYWKALIGTAGTWFIYDFVFFPNTIFSGLIISEIIHDGSIKSTAEWQLFLGTIVLPGTWLGIYLCNPLGRRYTMMLGFTGYIVFGLITGCGYDKITKIVPLFIFCYGMLHAMGSLVGISIMVLYHLKLTLVQGPGNLNGLVSAEGTFYGISAAVGKAGAAIGTEAFTPIQDNLGKKYTPHLFDAWTFIVAAICGVLGVVLTYFFVPEMTNIDFADEDEKFLLYLADNGWEGVVGDGDSAFSADEVVSVEEKEA